MPSDRARLSGDASRDYRALVFQQGRVTLEADTNEQVQLGETALREDIIDIIGPVGTPDDGYEVTSSGGSFEIGTGTYYVGGWRLTLDDPLPLGKGPDELDLTPPAPVDGQYAIALLVTEQEVSAVEDRALREVALGGPDTAQRTRLMQRGVAIQTDGESCSDSADAITKALEQQGAILDPATASILPTARLQVIPVAPPTPADPCDPPASGGYLGADNQLIRVTVTAFDPATKQGKLLWGYDNASTLYRAATSDGKVLTLEGEPIDNDHAPRLGQAVEVLRTRALFSHGDVIAGDSGLVTKVAQPYDPDLNRVEIDATLPTGQRGDANHPLFLRLWEAEIAFTAGTQIELGETGLAVKIQLDALGDGSIVARPFWAFAARPSTPILVYPRRYLDAGQPPEGPRQWLAPLAVVTGQKQGGEVTDDCRDTFLPLTKIRPGCCGITLSPDMDGHRDYIQNALDKLRGTRGIVSLRPGRYKLRKPIRLDASHKGLTLEGCSEGVFLEALDEEDPDFAAGLIVLDDVNEVYLRRLQFQMPSSPLDPKMFGREGKGGKDATGAEIDEELDTVRGSVAVSATGCAQLSITECQFRFRMEDKRGLFAIALLLRGECWGLKLTANRFLHDIDYEQARTAPRLMIGVALSPAIIFDARAKQRGLASARLDALLDAADISGNEFVGLTQAILIYARLGYIRVERNRVLGCSGGITILDSTMAAVYHALASAIAMLVPLGILSVLFQFAAVIPGAGEQDLDLTTADLQKSVREAQARGSQLARRLQIDLQGDGGLGSAITGLLGMAAAIDLKYRALTPVLHITGNDIDIFGTLSREPKPEEREERLYATRALTMLPQASLAKTAQFAALQVAVEHRDTPGGDMIVSANRATTAASRAVAIGLPHYLVFSGNLIRSQRERDEEPALTILADPESARIEVMANVVGSYARIMPDQRPAAPSQSWDFVNRLW